MAKSQSYLRMMEQAREDARMARKKRYRNMIGIALGGAGVATALAGMPIMASVALWGVGAAAWAILKAV